MTLLLWLQLLQESAHQTPTVSVHRHAKVVVVHSLHNTPSRPSTDTLHNNASIRPLLRTFSIYIGASR
jgi:hypothetical protein